MGASMKIEETERFEQHLNVCIKELSLALLLAKRGCDATEFLEIKRTIGDLIAKADALCSKR